MRNSDNILLIVPAYNEESVLKETLLSFKNAGFESILLVDDGSVDKTPIISNELGITTLSHPVNTGNGGAIRTGLGYAILKGYKYAITADADGQHSSVDVLSVKNTLIQNDYDLVIGSRIRDMKAGNPIRYRVNILSDFFTYLLSGKYISDTQSGLRGFNLEKAANLKLETVGYEIASEIIVSAVKNNFKIKEIDISSIYSNYSLAKGQKISNAMNIILRMLINFNNE